MRDQTLAPESSAPESSSSRPASRVLVALLVVGLFLAGVAGAAFFGGRQPLLDLFAVTAMHRSASAEEPDGTRQAFARYLENGADSPVVTGLAAPADRERIHRALVAFYEGNGHRPAWFDGRRPTAEARELVALLSRARGDGLDPRRYRPEQLEARLEALGWRTREREIYPLDTLLSQAFAVYGHHLASGRVDPDSLGPAWLIEPRRVKLVEALAEATGGAGPEAVAERLRPPHRRYDRLLEALERYRRIAADGGWSKVPEGPVLAEGDRAPAARLRALAARLAAEGDLDPAEADLGSAVRGDAGAKSRPTTAVVTPELAAAVHRFQERHGITEDGKVGPETTAALNTSAARRVRQIELNLERWRWLPGELGSRRVEVNLPGYFLRMVEGDRTVGTMKVVVGKAGAATPAFSDRMSYVEINPYWNVPDGIVAEEIAPQAASDPSWLSRNGYEVVGRDGAGGTVSPGAVDWSAARGGNVPFLVRQRPGPGNALGDIKFMFPNEHNIYLHDTPAKHLFEEVERTFSHGCIRVEHPLVLAAFVFRGDPKWGRERVEQAIASGQNLQVPLPREIPVFLLYWTAWVDDDGTVHFRKDIYDHDRALARALGEQSRGEVRTASR